MKDLRGELNSLRKEAQILNSRINELSLRLDEIEGVNKVNLSSYSENMEQSQIPLLDTMPENQNLGFTPLESVKNDTFTPLNIRKAKKYLNLETKIGKNLMGILASV